MKEIQLFLVPSPGSKPEFVATVQPVMKAKSDTSATRTTADEIHANEDPEQLWNRITSATKSIVMEGYTREGWAWKPSSSSLFVPYTWISTDRPQKLQGFVQYLKERQKCAYGRFHLPGKPNCLCVVSYVQPPPKQSKSSSSFRIDCRITEDYTQIPHCTLRTVPKNTTGSSNLVQPMTTITTAKNPNSSSSQAPPKQPQQQPSAAAASTTTRTTTKKGSGLLGKLVGAQQRTNVHVANAKSTTATYRDPDTGGESRQQTMMMQQQPQHTSPAPSSSSSSQPYNEEVEEEYKTAPQIFADFRQECQTKMLDFDMDEDATVLRVPISLAEYVRIAHPSEQSKITMEVLKYMVYEAAEEVNEEWIAYKEPSEFMDEIVITIYKEGVAPPEVVEEINKAELPDEIRGQQRHMVQDRTRQIEQKLAQEKRKVEQIALQKKKQNFNNTQTMTKDVDDNDDVQDYPTDYNDDDDDLEALNTKKRDRRTFQDYERERAAKRNR